MNNQRKKVQNRIQPSVPGLLINPRRSAPKHVPNLQSGAPERAGEVARDVPDELAGDVIDIRDGWRTLHVVDIENLLGGHHEDASVDEIRDVIHAYRELVGAGSTDLFFYGANPELHFRVWQAAPGGRLCGLRGKDGADRALIGIVTPDWVSGRFERVCIASGDQAFAPLAAQLKADGAHVVVVSLPMSVSADLYVAASEHRVLHRERVPVGA